MSAHKVIQLASTGVQSEYAGKNASAGAGDAGEFIIADSTGKIDATFLPNGIAADSVVLVAGEALAAGDFIYISGTSTALKADASAAAKAARGYVLASVLNGGNATVYFDESNSSVTGLTPGATYYLSGTTPGGVTTTPPTTAGQIMQQLGFAVSATNIHVNILEPVTRA